jgi:cell division protein FtsL
MVNVDIWQLLGVSGSLLGILISIILWAVKTLIGQFEKRLNEKFQTIDEQRTTEQKYLDNQFKQLDQARIEEVKSWQHIEREIMQMKVDLPNTYVRRDDYIRNQSVIESKIDGLAIRIENALLRTKNG